jgi:hypothetical protein
MDFATRRGAIIELRRVEEVFNPPGILQIIPTRVHRLIHTDDVGQRHVVTLIGEPYVGGGFQVTQCFSRPFEVRAGDHGHFRGPIADIRAVAGPRGPERLFLVRFAGANPAEIWLRESDMTFVEETPEPEAAVDGDDAPGGAKALAAAEAIAALWPAGYPDGLAAKERYSRVQAWCKDNGRSVPSVRTIQMVIERER